MNNKEIELIVSKLSKVLKEYIDDRMNKAATIIYKKLREKLKEEFSAIPPETVIEESLKQHFGTVIKESEKKSNPLMNSDFKFDLDNNSSPNVQQVQQQQYQQQRYVQPQMIQEQVPIPKKNINETFNDISLGRFDDVKGFESNLERIDYRDFLNEVNKHEKTKSTGF